MFEEMGIKALSQFAVGLDEGQLRDLLLDSSTELTPQQAADRLRMTIEDSIDTFLDSL